MKTRLFTLIVLFIAIFINSFAQSGTSLKLNPIQFNQTNTYAANNWLPIEIPKLHKKNNAFWKLTSEGFFVYSDGRYFYEENYFQRMLDISCFYGGCLKHININSLYNYAAFYPYRLYDNVCMSIMPVRNYSQYQKVNNTNTLIPVPVYFVVSGLSKTPAPLSVNLVEQTRNILKPVKLIDVKLIQVSQLEVRKPNVYNYEKTIYDNSIERNIEWRKNNFNVTNKNSFTKSNSGLFTKVTTSTSAASTTITKEIIGVKGGNNSTKSTESSKKSSE